MNIIRFFSDRSDTIVRGEVYGLVRERNEDEPVHYRLNDDELDCPQCGGYAAIWLSSIDKWEKHPDRCCK